jgi:hypothetical protein
MTHKPRRRQPRRHSVRSLIQQLDLLKWTFGPGTARAKVQAARQLERATLARTEDWLTYHDALCVLRTYPDNRDVMRQAERGLATFPGRLAAWLERAQQRAALELEDSGLACTDVVHPFSLELCDRLAARYPGRVEIDWDGADSESLDRLMRLQSLLVVWSENDSLDYDFELDALSWLSRVQTRHDRTKLEALLRLFRTSTLPRSVQRYLFDDLNLSVRFRLGPLPISRTRHRFPCPRMFYQDVPRLGRSADLRAALARPPAPLQKLSARRGQYYIDALQDAHAVRNRELFPVIFANPAESYLYEPGRGLQFVLFGMSPSLRLPFETNFGGLLVRNGMPLGYCIASPWFDRSELAINVFPAYRSGESAYVFEQFSGLLHHHFGILAFYVRSHQMGEDDPEPLESGAFWFYYKLGFRAVNPRVYALAEREMQKIRNTPNYRSSLPTLKRMSHTDVMLHTDVRLQSKYKEPPLVNLAYAITRWFAKESDGDRALGTRKAAALLARRLGLGRLRSWSDAERGAFDQWAPLLVQIPNWQRWKASERAHLAAILRAKGAGLERDYVHLCQTHPRLLDSLKQISRSVKR